MRNRMRSIHKKRKTLFTLTMFLFFTLPATSFIQTYEPNSGHLRGFIYKSDDKTPLWGAQVVLQDVKNRQVFRSNVTDSTGDYEVLDVPAGDYLVVVNGQDAGRFNSDELGKGIETHLGTS